MIEALDQWSIEQIKSSVVITSLVAVVKELVENALDSDATIINVRLTNYGLDGVTVQDNGCGIAEEDFPLLAVKHATSKLASHAELNSVEQLGFRGEALASICNMSKLQITTSTGGKFGHILDFDENGQVISDKQVAARKGTIASVTSFFHNLPVRQKTMQREYKKGLSDVTALLQTYAIIAPVTLLFEHITKDKARRAILKSQGANMKNRIAAVFSTNLASQLVEIKHESNSVQISGYVSRLDAKLTGGAGSGRQLIFINKRPSDQPNCSKCIKEFYKQGQQTGQPFFALNLDVAPDTIDVNCSPDKRMIVLHNEATVVRELSFALEKALCINAISVPRQEDTRTPMKQATLKLDRFKGAGTMIAQSGETSQKALEDNDSQEDKEGPDMRLAEPSVEPPAALRSDRPQKETAQTMQPEAESSFLTGIRSGRVEPVRVQVQSKGRGNSNQVRNQPEFQLYSRDASTDSSSSRCHSSHAESGERPRSEPAVGSATSGQDMGQISASRESISKVSARADPSPKAYLPDLDSLPSEGSELSQELSKDCVNRALQPIDETVSVYPPGFRPASELLSDPNFGVGPQVSSPPHQGQSNVGSCETPANPSSDPRQLEPASEPVEQRAKTPDDNSTDAHAGEQPDSEVVQDHTQSSGSGTSSSGSSGKKRRPAALGHRVSLKLSLDGIANAREASDQMELPDVRNLDIASEEAEKRLSLVIKKDDFAQMTVVGQFNVGFIIVTKKSDSASSDHKDIFVIDQHASDEIYNFEKLQTTVASKPQNLVQPLLLQLSPVEELTLLDNMEIFKHNGFFFEIDPTATPGRQCKLKTVPYFKTLTFGKDDVYELIHKIQEDPTNKKVKCSKLRSMFAMRACRMSIMIGTVLSESTMTRVVRHLGELKKPWNCPHGRPTLRHITTLR